MGQSAAIRVRAGLRSVDLRLWARAGAGEVWSMRPLEHVPVAALDPRRFESVVSASEYAALLALIDRSARSLQGRVIWNVNSTASGGGVVELLRPLLGYSRGGGVDARWVVIAGDASFFAITKRLHNHLHGTGGDGGRLGAAERAVYERSLDASGRELADLVHPDDVVILHDPQTAGLVPAIHDTGAMVIWRCHVGVDHANVRAREGWDFLLRYLDGADAYIFSRPAFVWDRLAREKLAVIQPSIDVFSAKNADQRREQSLAILAQAGLVSHRGRGDPTFTRSDGTPGRVDRCAQMVEVAPPAPSDRVVVQVSRWDRLKDPLGVLNGFAEHVAARTDAHLLLAGPATTAVADDPEGAGVFACVREAWHGLPDDVARRVHLASLPMDDLDENAAIVNALQRHADVVVQKSLAEGFGLTVAEAMWKRRAVVASRIGGIQDQIVDGVSGSLVADPNDLSEFGSALVRLLGDPGLARRMGDAAHERVRDHFLGPHHLGLYFALIERLVAARS
jgi:trehalose synthase